MLFTINYVGEDLPDSLDLICATDFYEIEFNCPADCPEVIERTEAITACAETRVNIFERLDLSPNKTYEVDNEAVVDGIYEIGNAFGCEMGTKEIEIRCFDANGCLVETINLEITVIPAVFGDIFANIDASCEVTSVSYTHLTLPTKA